jgi:hypothetical protein
MTEYLSINVLATFTLLLAIAVLLLFLYAKRSRTQLRSSIKLINDLYQVSQSQQTQIKTLERASVTKPPTMPTSDDASKSDSIVIALQARLDTLERQYSILENRTELLQREDPELKMYNKASELVKAGASIEDVLEASQLPRAEVEVLMSLHKSRKPSQNK